jgi:putative protease
LLRLGNTPFTCSDVRFTADQTYFVPASKLNAARRELLDSLLAVRRANRPRSEGGVHKNNIPFPERQVDYTGNALNAKARAFYHRHGVTVIEPAAETGLDLAGRVVMTTKYCLRRELGICRGSRSETGSEPMLLRDEEGRNYEVTFLCGPCGMQIKAPQKETARRFKPSSR